MELGKNFIEKEEKIQEKKFSMPDSVVKEIGILKKKFFHKTRYNRSIKDYYNGYFGVGVLRKPRDHYQKKNVIWLCIVIYDQELNKLIKSDYFMTEVEAMDLGRLLLNVVGDFSENKDEQFVIVRR